HATRPCVLRHAASHGGCLSKLPNVRKSTFACNLLVGTESDRQMASIAKRLALRLPAPAQRRTIARTLPFDFDVGVERIRPVLANAQNVHRRRRLLRT